MKFGRNLFLAYCLILLPGAHTFARAEEPSPSAAEATPEETPQPTAPPQLNLAKRPATRGLFYGHVWFIDDNLVSFTVKPTDHALPRRRFYLDSKTTVKMGKKNVGRDGLYLGDKVAVRYFSNQGIFVADAVFIVEGEFVPADYLPKKPKPKKSEGSAEAAPAGHE